MSLCEAHSFREKALELTGNDHPTAQRLLAMIAETNRTTLASLQASIAASAWDGVAGAAHRIAGSARLLACADLIALLTELEARARERERAAACKLLVLVVDALAKFEASIHAAVGGIVGTE
ncbi:MAG TPA: Hpt domain-containing protein [Paraburkholderia sp.]|jgi:HPt (histidine-containing phosphotransfer) domain-containing protein